MAERNLHPVCTCHVHRYNVLMDVNARLFNAFEVELMGGVVIVYSKENDADGWPVEHKGDVGELWPTVMATLAQLRAWYDALPDRVLPVSVFQPYARITLIDHQRESALATLPINMHIGGCDEVGEPHHLAYHHPDSHMRRVKALCAAMDSLDYIAGRRVATVQ